MPLESIPQASVAVGKRLIADDLPHAIDDNYETREDSGILNGADSSEDGLPVKNAYETLRDSFLDRLRQEQARHEERISKIFESHQRNIVEVVLQAVGSSESGQSNGRSSEDVYMDKAIVLSDLERVQALTLSHIEPSTGTADVAAQPIASRTGELVVDEPPLSPPPSPGRNPMSMSPESPTKSNSRACSVLKQKQLKHNMSLDDLKEDAGWLAWFLRRLDHPLLNVILVIQGWWARQKEPERHGALAKLIRKPLFEMVCLNVIILNGVYTIFTTNYAMAEMTSESTRTMDHLDFSFLLFYVLELGLKLAVHRFYFFINDSMSWNLFDFVLVVLALFEQVGSLLLHSSGVDMTFMRSLRLLKISKVFRMFRVLRFFSQLRLILDCVLGSILSLFWSCVLLSFFNVIFSMVLVQGIGQYLMSDPSDLSFNERDYMLRAFASVQEGVLTLFHATTGGDWGIPFASVRRAGFAYAIGFICFVLFYHVAFINIVTSIFIDRAMKLALPDMETQMIERRREDIQTARDLMQIVEELDVDASGSVNHSEFHALMENSRIQAYFEHHGLDVKDADILFKVLAASVGGDEVELHELVDGCLKIRGAATSLDLVTLIFEMRLCQRGNLEFQKNVIKTLDYLGSRIDYAQQHMSRGHPTETRL